MSERSDHPLTVRGEPRAFFGRRSGKRLHSGQQALVETLQPRLEIAAGESPIALDQVFPDRPHRVLEIGYGGGEFLANLARTCPDTGFIGCEVFTGGIGKLVQAIAEGGIDNIRLFTDDAIKLLTRLPNGGLDAVYLLYPDPWPKSRHHKRRFVSPTTLAALARVIRPGGHFRFATDIEDYAVWTLAHIVREPRFAFMPERPGLWHEPFPGWVVTRYEAKARREGRATSFYLTFARM